MEISPWAPIIVSLITSCGGFLAIQYQRKMDKRKDAAGVQKDEADAAKTITDANKMLTDMYQEELEKACAKIKELECANLELTSEIKRLKAKRKTKNRRTT